MKFITCFVLSLIASTGNALTVLSDRPKQRLASTIQDFEQRSGKTVTFIEESTDKLIARLMNNEKADVVIVKDMVFLDELLRNSLLSPIQNEALFGMVHPSMVDLKRRWLPLSYRTRSLIYSTGLNPDLIDSISNYSDLSNPELQHMLCVRTSNHSYNFGLGAYLIESLGYNKAVGVLSGWAQNLAKTPFAGDRPIIAAVANGECDLGIINNYYLGAALASQPNLEVGYKVLLDSTGGAHTNGTVIGISFNSNAVSDAQMFIDIAFEDENQFNNASLHFDYPGKLSVIPTYLPKSWQDPKLSLIPWSQVMENLQYVPDLFYSAGYP